jgi:hypothetical protein
VVEPFLDLTKDFPVKFRPRLIGKPGQTRHFLKWDDGCKVYLRSAEKISSYDGLNVAWLYGDELRYWRKRAYDAAIARVRVPGPLNCRTFTSIPEIGFMSEEFATGKPNRSLFTCGTGENSKNLEPGYVENLRLSFSPRLQKAVIDGIFTVLEGAVFDQLDPDFWRSEWAVDFDPAKDLRGKKVYLAIDPGYRKSAWLWIAEINPLEWVVFDEMQPEQRSDAWCVQSVNGRKWPVHEIWCDPAADNTQSAMSIDTIQMLKGIECKTNTPIRYISGAFRSVGFGVDKARTILGDPGNGLPVRVKFAKRLQEIESRSPRGIVKDLISYRYGEDRLGRRLGSDPLKDGTTDHACDAFRYWAVGMWLTTGLRRLDRSIDVMANGTQGYRVQ